MKNLESLRRFVRKKGIGYFLYADDECKKHFEGILFFQGRLNIELLRSLV